MINNEGTFQSTTFNKGVENICSRYYGSVGNIEAKYNGFAPCLSEFIGYLKYSSNFWTNIINGSVICYILI
jgi:hypothetical protein